MNAIGEEEERQSPPADRTQTSRLGMNDMTSSPKGDRFSTSRHRPQQSESSPSAIADGSRSYGGLPKSSSMRSVSSTASATSISTVGQKPRPKSFVGLQIMTAPRNASPQLVRSPATPHGPLASGDSPVAWERGPGSPLFPSSFSSLSVEPNLGRSASVALAGGVKATSPAEDFRRVRGGVVRKPSGAGLSESEYIVLLPLHTSLSDETGN